MSNNKSAQKENKTKQENQTVMQERRFMEHWKWWDGPKETQSPKYKSAVPKFWKYRNNLARKKNFSTVPHVKKEKKKKKESKLVGTVILGISTEQG